MKFSMPLSVLLVALLVAGCASPGSHSQPAKTPAQKTTPSAAAPIVTPDNSLSGKVASYNSAGRFVVLDFPVGQMPQLDETLFLYRDGLKVAELKVTGPQMDDDTVADLIQGDAQVGDEVRDR